VRDARERERARGRRAGGAKIRDAFQGMFFDAATRRRGRARGIERARRTTMSSRCAARAGRARRWRARERAGVRLGFERGATTTRRGAGNTIGDGARSTESARLTSGFAIADFNRASRARDRAERGTGER